MCIFAGTGPYRKEGDGSRGKTSPCGIVTRMQLGEWDAASAGRNEKQNASKVRILFCSEGACVQNLEKEKKNEKSIVQQNQRGCASLIRKGVVLNSVIREETEGGGNPFG